MQLNHHDPNFFKIKKTYESKLLPLLNDLWGNKKPGFVRIIEDDENWLQSIQWSQNLKEKFKKLVVLGIGGSSMGGRALANYRYNNSVYFLDNIDASEIQSVWNQVKDSFDQTGFLIISKSGESIEIAALIETFVKEAQMGSLDFFKNAFVISEKKPSLFVNLAREKNMPLIEIPTSVGGRFSVLTAVGLVVAGFMGFDIPALRTGACKVQQEKEKILGVAAELCHAIDCKTDLFIFWSYSSKLRWFNQWLCQLWAESLGKSKTNAGDKTPKIPWIVGATGTSDQHSIYQHILESEQKKYVLITQSLDPLPKVGFSNPILSFFKSKSYSITDILSAEREATARALGDYGVPVTEMLCATYDDFTIGYLFFYFESLTVLIGNYYNINPYDQPAVQLGKKLTLENLGL